MGQRQKNWAARARDALFDALGNRCANCGCRTELEFDCIVAQGDAHHKMEWSQRISFYRFHFSIGNLQILCATCNRIKGEQTKRYSSQQLFQSFDIANNRYRLSQYRNKRHEL